MNLLEDAKVSINTHTKILAVIQAIILAALWVIPFVIPFKYSVYNFLCFFTYSLIPLIFFTLAFITFVINQKRKKRLLKLLTNVFDILAVASFVIIMVCNYTAEQSEANIRKTAILSEAVKCEYFIGTSENELTEYTSGTDKATGFRPEKDSGAVYLNRIYGYDNSLGMILHEMAGDKGTLFEWEITYIDGCSEFLSAKFCNQTKKELIKEYGIFFDETDLNGYNCYYSYMENWRSGFLVADGSGQLLIVRLSPVDNSDKEYIEANFTDIMAEIRGIQQ